MYPMLLLWGVQDRCTAAIASEISKLVAMLGSLQEVEQVLSDRGQPLDFKTIRTIAYRFATRARAAQRVGNLNWGETVAGRRVVISTDGGRIRIRTTKRGPKTAKGRNRYRTDWREPKLLIIYVVDEKGQMDREFLAVIDGTLGGPDAIFKLMEFYLRELKISTADKILFVADGTRWIWNRVRALLRRLGVKPEQVNELVALYLLQGTCPSASSVRYLVSSWVALPGLLAVGILALPRRQGVAGRGRSGDPLGTGTVVGAGRHGPGLPGTAAGRGAGAARDSGRGRLAAAGLDRGEPLARRGRGGGVSTNLGPARPTLPRSVHARRLGRLRHRPVVPLGDPRRGGVGPGSGPGEAPPGTSPALPGTGPSRGNRRHVRPVGG